MITLGLRASPKKVTLAVYDSEDRAILNVEAIRIPAAFSPPDALKYIRNNILDVLREFKIEAAGIRTTEPNAQRMSIERIQIEGVIQEAFASSFLSKYYVGQISSISSKIKINLSDFKKYVEGEVDLGMVENWSGLDKEGREAVLCAMGAANA